MKITSIYSSCTGFNNNLRSELGQFDIQIQHSLHNDLEDEINREHLKVFEI